MQRTVVERDDKLENEKLALEKENLRKVMDNFSLSTGLSVVAVNLYGEVLSLIHIYIGLTIVGYLYRQGIEKRAMGYACAVGLVLLIVVMIVNLIQLTVTGTFKKEER